MQRVNKARWQTVLVCAALAAVTLAVYAPAVHCAFTNYDDPDYVTDNPQISAGVSWHGLAWAFGRLHGERTYWHPLTWVSHMADCQMFGLNPMGHHLVNVLLHTLNTVLVFWVFWRMTGAAGRCALLAGLFALHPLQVETVAWVAERKNLLSGFFFLLTLWAYVRYAQVRSAECPSSPSSVAGPLRRTGVATLRRVDGMPVLRSTAEGGRNAEPRKHASRFTFHVSLFYLLSLTFFALGLMSKPVLVTLPFVLLLLDYWPLGRFDLRQEEQRLRTTTDHAPRTADHAQIVNCIMEKVPFLALAAASSAITIAAHQALGSMKGASAGLSLGARLDNALVSYARYLGKAVWPSHLAVLYPHPGHWPMWQAAGSGLLVLAICAVAVAAARRRRYVLVGWFWFLGVLVPFIGLIQAGEQAMADRFAYLPLIGLFLVPVWGLFVPSGRSNKPAAAESQGEGALNPLKAGTLAAGRRRAFNPFNRFNKLDCLQFLFALLVLSGCIAGTRMQLRHWRDSKGLFRHALAVTTANRVAHHNLGTALAEEGSAQEAAQEFRAALRINPLADDTASNLGRLLADHGKPEEGKAELEALLRRNPRHAGAHRNLGHILFTEEKGAEGLAHYALAAQLQPEDATTPEDLATALARPAAAPLEPPKLAQALDLLPAAEMRARVAGMWSEQGRFEAALQGYRAALALQPQSPDILNNLAWLLATCPEPRVRDGAEAVRLGEQACKLTGGKRTIMVGTLAAAYAEAGRFAEAVATAQRACALAAAAGNKTLAARNEELLELYRTGRAYREAARP